MTEKIKANPAQIKQQYFIYSQTTRRSSFNGQPMTTVEMIGVNDRKEYKTYIQKSNKNYKHWETILVNPEKGIFATFDNVSFTTSKDGKDTILSADSKPNEIQIGDIKTYADELDRIWAEEDALGLTGNPIFDNLFKVEK